MAKITYTFAPQDRLILWELSRAVGKNDAQNKWLTLGVQAHVVLVQAAQEKLEVPTRLRLGVLHMNSARCRRTLLCVHTRIIGINIVISVLLYVTSHTEYTSTHEYILRFFLFITMLSIYNRIYSFPSKNFLT